MVGRRSRAAAGALALAGALASCGESAPPRPNVLLVTIDTLRADRLGTHGYERDTSPALDRFADSACVFERAQSTAPWTLPGVAGVLTSLYTSTTGCWDFESSLDPSFVTLPEILRDAGYDTAAVTSHVYVDADRGLAQGVTHFDTELVLALVESHKQISSETVTDKGLAFLEQKAALPDEDPWMLWLHYFDPHEVYQPHAGISEAFGTEAPSDLYDGEIAFTDLHLGRLFDALDAWGLSERTVVVVTADHGEELRDHGGMGHGSTLYREVLRVPLMIRAPGFAPARSDAVASTVDVLPTVLELAGLPAPTPIHGRSLVPVLAGGELAPRAVLGEARLSADPLATLVDERFKLIVGGPAGAAQLYDLELDPLERNDLASDRTQRVAELRHRLAELERRATRDASGFTIASGASLVGDVADAMGDLGYGGDEEDE